MEKEKNIFDYIGQVFAIFGGTVLILNLFCLLFGESAREVSQMFSLGSSGLSVSVMLQFFGVSILIVVLRFLFFTDRVIKRMSLFGRTISMFAGVLIIIAAFIVLFDWFPINMWKPWLGFLVSFGASVGISTGISLVKERLENKKMTEALERLKQEK